jgi:hypothetical protein
MLCRSLTAFGLFIGIAGCGPSKAELMTVYQGEIAILKDLEQQHFATVLAKDNAVKRCEVDKRIQFAAISDELDAELEGLDDGRLDSELELLAKQIGAKQVLHVHVNERSYSIVDVEQNRPVLRTASLEDIVALAKKHVGDDTGVRIRVSFSKTSGVTAGFTLRDELHKAGIPAETIELEPLPPMAVELMAMEAGAAQARQEDRKKRRASLIQKKNEIEKDVEAAKEIVVNEWYEKITSVKAKVTEQQSKVDDAKKRLDEVK